MTEIPQGFTAQLTALLPRLRRFARTLTGHVSDADDVVQAALEKALLHHRQWDPASRLDSWMFRIVRNAWIDEVRARRRRPVVDIDAVPESESAVVPAVQTDLLSVQQALARLPEEQRTAVTLVLVEGLSYKEAAAVTDVPIGTLTSRLARGREALQRLLDPNGISP